MRSERVKPIGIATGKIIFDPKSAPLPVVIWGSFLIFSVDPLAE